MKNKELTIIHENYLASVANDLTTLGLLAGMFWINQQYLEGAIPDIVLIGMFILYACSRFSFSKRRMFTTREQAQNFIDEFYAPTQEDSKDD